MELHGFFSLCVGVAFYGAPQECLRRRLLFVEALCFGVCYGVSIVFFSTCHTEKHVGEGGMWM
jgi:hypothetical protein